MLQKSSHGRPKTGALQDGSPKSDQNGLTAIKFPNINIFYLYALLLAAAICVTVLPAPAATTLHRYHISAAELRGLDISFIIFAAVIWFAAFYGYHKLRNYTQLIKREKDGRQVSRLATGLLLLAIGSPLSSIASGLLSWQAQHHPALLGASSVVPNYISAIFPLVAFMCIARGAFGLCQLQKLRLRFHIINIIALTVIILGVIFCFLVARSHSDIRLTYHMSYGFVMLTLAIPYMYTWFLGLFAVAEIQAYSRQLTGIVYRKGWKRLVFGLGAIILLSILIQYLTTLSAWLVGLSLSWILLLLYALLLLLAGAYILVALGTKQLMKIEEV